MDRRRDRASVAADYRARLAAHEARAGSLDRHHDRLGALRLAVATAAIAIGVGAWGVGRLSPWWLAVPVVVFVGLMVRHARVLDARTEARRAAAYVAAGLARLEHRWQGTGSPGSAWQPADHLYAEDLDLFGAGSLFELLSTARTTGGEAVLAGWLTSPSPPPVVVARQEAVRELAGRDQLREDLAVLGPDVRERVQTAALVAWAAQPVMPPPRAAHAILAALSAVTLAGGWTWTQTGSLPAWLVAAVAVQGAVGLWWRPRVLAAIRALEPRVRDLAVVAAVAARVERERFSSAQLVGIVDRLTASGRPAAAEVRRLSRHVHLLTSRRNQFFAPVAFLLFWATHLSWAIDRWRRDTGPAVAGWLDALAELEALASLATYDAEHPGHVFPTFLDGPPRLTATALAHPLLPHGDAVGNDVTLGGDGPALWLVSGSNMSGKSTWLRAIGTNVVLAQAGAPVRAAAMALTPLLPGGTLRVQDSLQAGRSRFFAEITKVRAIVEAARGAGPGHPPVLFLLDELFAGTNSHDRQRGAACVLGGLVDLGAIGLATTHDLALTTLTTALGPRAANAHFADRFDGGGLEFDYQLRPGVVGTSNALALMRSVGLDV
ncbi:MAG: DNA mismatch repair protein MutS [Vicinamibacterales bacterium]